MSPSEKYKRRLKAVVAESKYRLILSKIHYGYRPSEIAKQLGVPDQNIKYYTSNLMDLGLISKEGDKSGITWKVTEKGLFILKQFIIQSVDYQASHASFIHNMAKVPIRLHNISFAFSIISPLDDLKIQWEALRNGVCKHTFIKGNKEQEHTVEIIKSPNHGNSCILIHMNERYTFDIYNDFIKLYDEARAVCVQIANKLKIDVSPTGELIKKPHLAFESDLIALYLATFETASTNTVNKKGKVWIDASHGLGELETNDPEYAYKHLVMPENVFETHKVVQMIKEVLSGYKVHYDPLLTHNN